jgi:hypothetical protein
MAQYAAEFLIARLREQIELAPKMEENPAPGGNFVPWDAGDMVQTVVDRVKEGMAQSRHISALKPVEAGARRYCAAFEEALVHVENLANIFTQLRAVQGASYGDGEQRQKAMSRHKDKPKEIIAACTGAILALEKAMAVLDEGETKQSKQEATQRAPMPVGAK